MSGKGGQARVDLRHRAVGMLIAGKSSREVGKYLDVNQSVEARWYKKYKNGEPLTDRKRSGRPTVQTKIFKLILAKH